MKRILLLAGLTTIAIAQPKLHLTVHHGSGQVGYDVNSTLISGEKDMIVIDPQFTLSEAHKLAAEILESKKNLTAIYITHDTEMIDEVCLENEKSLQHMKDLP